MTRDCTRHQPASTLPFPLSASGSVPTVQSCASAAASKVMPRDYKPTGHHERHDGVDINDKAIMAAAHVADPGRLPRPPGEDGRSRLHGGARNSTASPAPTGLRHSVVTTDVRWVIGMNDLFARRNRTYATSPTSGRLCLASRHCVWASARIR